MPDLCRYCKRCRPLQLAGSLSSCPPDYLSCGIYQDYRKSDRSEAAKAKGQTRLLKFDHHAANDGKYFFDP